MQILNEKTMFVKNETLINNCTCLYTLCRNVAYVPQPYGLQFEESKILENISASWTALRNFAAF